VSGYFYNYYIQSGCNIHMNSHIVTEFNLYKYQQASYTLAVYLLIISELYN